MVICMPVEWDCLLSAPTLECSLLAYRNDLFYCHGGFQVKGIICLLLYHCWLIA